MNKEEHQEDSTTRGDLPQTTWSKAQAAAPDSSPHGQSAPESPPRPDSRIPPTERVTLSGNGQADQGPGTAAPNLLGSMVRSIRLEACLGKGGMGEVYLGLDTNLGRKVAVKVIRGPMRFCGEAKARFKREAIMLSQLEHANICRVYDFIETEDSDYLVMEFIQGRSLKAAAQTGLSHTSKLEIARDICKVLAEAHDRQIIHRDLKPDNVMIDENRQVKVLDFGLARPVDVPYWDESLGTSRADHLSFGQSSPSGSNTFETKLGAVIGTPMFMSPEQTRGERVNGAGDMYALGLVLQWLFTGELPYPRRLKRLELMRLVAAGKTLPVKGLDGPLTALITRLKSPAPEMRPTAVDTWRSLESILRQPARQRKRRITAAVMLVLALTTGFSVMESIKAHRAQTRAESAEQMAAAARDRAVAVNTFLRAMLSSADPWGEGGPELKVIDVLEQAESDLDQELADHPLTKAEVLIALAESHTGLGNFDKAVNLTQRARALYQLQPEDNQEAMLRIDLSLAVLFAQSGKMEQARLTVEAASKKVLAGWTDHHDLYMTAVLAQSEILLHNKEAERCESLLRRHMEVLARVLPDYPKHYVGFINNLASSLWMQDHLEEAVRWQRKVVTLCAEKGEDHPAFLEAQANLATILSDKGDLEEAVALEQKLLVKFRNILGDKHESTLNHRLNLAFTLRATGNLAGAEEQLRIIIGHRDQDHPALFTAYHQLATTLKDEDRLEEAEQWDRAALEGRLRVLGPAHRFSLTSMHKLATTLSALARTEEAESLARRAYEGKIKTLGEDHAYTLNSGELLGRILTQRHQYQEAEILLRRMLAFREAARGPDHQDTLDVLYLLAANQLAAGHRDEANLLFQRGADHGHVSAQQALQPPASQPSAQ